MLNLRLASAVVAVLISCRVGLGQPQPDATGKPEPSKTVQLLPLPEVKLNGSGALQEADKARIKNLIDDLVRFSQADFGMSPTLSGDAFAPLPGLSHSHAMVLTQHNLRTNASFLELVKIGPKAIPQLLDALTDARPTALTITHDTPMGGMWFAHEMWGNPANDHEHAVLGDLPKRDPGGFPDGTMTKYTVTVGDVCFVIIGQITGRPYSAVPYQPSACIVINSPVHDPKLAEQARKIWSDPDPAKRLLDSLLTDFSTRGVHTGNSLDHWSIGAGFQVGAATRLLYYFPDQTAALIAKRLDGLDVTQPPGGLDASMDQTVANGVRADDFIAAVSWSDRPEITAALGRLLDRTDDPELFVKGLPSEGEIPEAATAKLVKMLEALPPSDPAPYGKTYKLLCVLARQPVSKAKPEFARIAQGALEQRRAVCMALKEVHPSFAVEVLTPLLEDKQPCDGWTHPEVEGANQPRSAIRVCDEAADAMAASDPSISFRMVGTTEQVDAQIDAIRKALQGRK